MIIEHIGHSEFSITLENGHRIITDPYDASTGYPVKELMADTVLISHHHHDHDAVDHVKGHPGILDAAGVKTLATDTFVTGFESYHDDENGSKRGKNLIWLLEAEGLRVAHFGDIGCYPDEEQMMALSRIDVLMIPVGGFYTIDAVMAKNISDRIQAGIVLPMHYKTCFNAEWPINGPEAFAALCNKAEVRYDAEILRVNREDMKCQPKVVFFKQGV